jgi:hypothetical protein
MHTCATRRHSRARALVSRRCKGAEIDLVKSGLVMGYGVGLYTALAGDAVPFGARRRSVCGGSRWVALDNSVDRERSRGCQGAAASLDCWVPAGWRAALRAALAAGFSGQAARLQPEPLGVSGPRFSAFRGRFSVGVLFDIVRRGRDARAAPRGFEPDLLGFGSGRDLRGLCAASRVSQATA